MRTLQSHGIRVHGSTIIGLEHHTPENIDDEIQRAVAHDTVFHQFMLYTPIPGTPLYSQVQSEGRLAPDASPLGTPPPKASAMSAVALAKAELPDTLSRGLFSG